MPSDDVADLLRGLGVRVSREAILALVAHATTSRLSPVQTLEELCAVARRERDQRNLAARAKAATIGSFKPLERFDWNHPRTIQRDLVDELCSLDFIAKGHNVLLRGPSGVGKTMLAQNLAMLALQRGHTVRFTTLSAALADLLKQESLPALERRLRKYTTPSLLILDEIGYLPCSRQSADLLYNIISRRHEARSLVLTTNLPFKQWSTVFPGAACVSALIDRFVQHCHIVDIDADSWRQKEALSMSEPRPNAPQLPPEPPPSTPTTTPTKKKR
jgi:DNA replication protein DnaC